MKIGDKMIDLDFPEWGAGTVVEDEDFFGPAILFDGDEFPVIYRDDQVEDLIPLRVYNSKLYKALK